MSGTTLGSDTAAAGTGSGSFSAASLSASPASLGFAVGLPEGHPAWHDVFQLSPLAILFASLLMLLNAGMSLWLSLGLQRTIAFALVRCVVQLALLGWVLLPILQLNLWWVTLLFGLAMIALASAEATSRPPAAYEGMYLHVLGCLGGASSIVLLYCLLLVLQPKPFWAAQFLIPTLAAVLGNTLCGISAGLSCVAEELTSGRGQVEQLLSLGATRMEATWGVLQKAVLQAVAPSLQQMSVVGLVTVPSFMSGEIIAGTSPTQAAGYQVVVLTLIASSTVLGSTAAVFLAVLSTVDGQHRLHPRKWVKRRSHEVGVEGWIRSRALEAAKGMRQQFWRVATRVRIACFGRGRRQGATASRRRRIKTWFARTSLGRRVLARFESQGSEYEEDVSISGNLREVFHGGFSDDESVLSGPLSDDGREALLLDDAHSRRDP